VRQPRADDSSDGEGAEGGEGSDDEQQPATEALPKRPRMHKSALPSSVSPRGAAAAGVLAQLSAPMSDAEKFINVGNVVDDLYEKSDKFNEMEVYRALLTASELDDFYNLRSVPACQDIVCCLNELEGADIIFRTQSADGKIRYFERGHEALLEAADRAVAGAACASERRAERAAAELAANARALNTRGRGSARGRGGGGGVSGTRNG
jgi:hypothetical protein